MAIQWGATSGYFRLGIDVIVSGTTATIIVYGQSVGYGHSWSETLNFTGSWSGSKIVSFYSGVGQTVTKELHRSSASFTGTRTYGANISYWSGSASVTRSVTISDPKPKPPSSLSVSRDSDSAINLSWVRESVYTAVVVQRQKWNRSTMSYGSWQQVGRPTGHVAAFTDTSLGGGQAAKYRVAGVNSGGQSAWSGVSDTVRTTPAAPVSVSAQRQGESALVTWQWGADQLSDGARVYRNGTLVGTVGQGYGGGVTPEWVDTSLPTGEFSYQVRAFAKAVGNAGTEVVSALSAASNTLSTLSPPAAPGSLTPNGPTLQVGGVTLRWTHVPTDTTAQTAGQVQWRLGTGTWTTVNATTASSVTISVPTAGTVQWQARTKGQHASWGPWSPTASFTVVNAPTVAINSPTGEEPLDEPTVAVVWAYTQAQGRPQSAWRATLYGPDGPLEARSGSGSTSSVRFTTRLEHDTAYHVVVEAATGDIWSDPAEQAFTTFFVPPAVPMLAGEWNDEAGAHELSFSAGETAGVPPTVTLELHRSIDGGESWELVAEATGGTSLTDYEGLSRGETLYRLTAYTAVGAASEMVLPILSDSVAVWLGKGTSFERTVGLRHSLKLTFQVGLAYQSLYHFSGRTLPEEISGDAVDRRVAVSGTLLPERLGMESHSVDDFDALAASSGTVLYRDPEGRRWFGALLSVSAARAASGVGSVSFTVRETARPAREEADFGGY